MAGDSIGKQFRVTTFGESHGELVGALIEGCPAGLKVDLRKIQVELDRRRPGRSPASSPRKELDEVHFVSGLYENITTGAPITAWVKNSDAKPQDYETLCDSYRPSHADYTYETKYGIRDPRGGGRASARETVGRVIAGALAKQLLALQNIQITAFTSQIGEIPLEKPIEELLLSIAEENPVRCPDPSTAQKMLELIETEKKRGDTLGGKICCVIKGCPPGLGEPVFDKLSADLGKAMLSIHATKGFEYGSGFKGTAMRGSAHNDPFTMDASGNIRTTKNDSGGIQGGISNGMDIVFQVAFKPVSTIRQPQDTLDRNKNSVKVEGIGRHDVCVVPRAVPIVEAMAAIILTDHLLRHRSTRLDSGGMEWR